MGMMKRREFLIGGALGSALAGPQKTLEVEVMEVFSSPTGPSALLVHHADEATRETYATWLRSNSGKQITCELRSKTSFAARIFRIRLCFGRGLILLSSPSVGIAAKDILKIK
jgi:hypothetical protein